MTEQTQTTEKQHGFTEAPASWNIRYRVNGFDEQLTLRGESFASIKDQVDAARAYVKTNFAPGARAAADAVNTEPTEPAALTAPPAGSGAQATAAAPSTPTALASAGKLHAITITKLEVVPRADGRVDLKFYGAGHKYPDLLSTRTPENAVELLAATGQWTQQHFAGAGVYQVKMLIEWTESEKRNAQGNPYRDIVSAQPA